MSYMDFSSNKQSRKQEPKGSFHAWNAVVVKIIIKPKMWKLTLKYPHLSNWPAYVQCGEDIIRQPFWKRYVTYLKWPSEQQQRNILFITLQDTCYILDFLIVGETRPFKILLERQCIKTICDPHRWGRRI